jgi:hypothetical protein
MVLLPLRITITVEVKSEGSKGDVWHIRGAVVAKVTECQNNAGTGATRVCALCANEPKV